MFQQESSEVVHLPMAECSTAAAASKFGISSVVNHLFIGGLFIEDMIIMKEVCAVANAVALCHKDRGLPSLQFMPTAKSAQA